MVRILHVVTHMNRGGLETMIMNYYRNIDRDKVQFDFLTHRDHDGDYGEEIKELGGIIYHLPRLNPFSRGYKKALRTFFTEHKQYDIIHVHQDCLSSVILKVAAEAGIKHRIAHSHNSNQDHNFRYLIKLYYRKKIPECSTDLFACSKEAGDWMFGNHKYKLLNNAIDSEEYAYNEQIRRKARSDLKIEDNVLLLGHVGRFSPQKNHDFLIDIFKEINDRVPAKLLLVGSGELMDKTIEKVESLGITDRVIFAGLRSDVPDMLQAMDVFVFPSLYEGLPVSMVEAQAAGLCCVISDKVPIECKITDFVKQIPLEADAEYWAEQIISAADYEREGTKDAIKRAGFDIKENAARLQEYYLNL